MAKVRNEKFEKQVVSEASYTYNPPTKEYPETYSFEKDFGKIYQLQLMVFDSGRWSIEGCCYINNSWFNTGFELKGRIGDIKKVKEADKAFAKYISEVWLPEMRKVAEMPKSLSDLLQR